MQDKPHKLFSGTREDHERGDAKQDNLALKDPSQNDALLRGHLGFSFSLSSCDFVGDRGPPLKDVATPASCLLHGFAAHQIHSVEPNG